MKIKNSGNIRTIIGVINTAFELKLDLGIKSDYVFSDDTEIVRCLTESNGSYSCEFIMYSNKRDYGTLPKLIKLLLKVSSVLKVDVSVDKLLGVSTLKILTAVETHCEAECVEIVFNYEAYEKRLLDTSDFEKGTLGNFSKFALLGKCHFLIK